MKNLSTILDTMFIELMIDQKFDVFDPWGDLARMEIKLMTSQDWESYFIAAISCASIIDDGGWTLINVYQEALDILKKYSKMESDGLIYKIDWTSRPHEIEEDSPLTSLYQEKYCEIPF